MSQFVISARIKREEKKEGIDLGISFIVQRLYEAINREAMFIHFNKFCDCATMA